MTTIGHALLAAWYLGHSLLVLPVLGLMLVGLGITLREVARAAYRLTERASSSRGHAQRSTFPLSRRVI